MDDSINELVWFAAVATSREMWEGGGNGEDEVISEVLSIGIG